MFRIWEGKGRKGQKGPKHSTPKGRREICHRGTEGKLDRAPIKNPTGEPAGLVKALVKLDYFLRRNRSSEAPPRAARAIVPGSGTGDKRNNWVFSD